MEANNYNFPKHIYYADDDADDRGLFADALSEIDNSIVLTLFENGVQLADTLCSQPEPFPDIIFLDINMPILTGFECLKRISEKIGGLENMRIVMFTTSRDRRNIQDAFKLGATHYAVKPSTYSDLLILLKRTLNLNWAERSEHTFVLTAY